MSNRDGGRSVRGGTAELPSLAGEADTTGRGGCTSGGGWGVMVTDEGGRKLQQPRRNPRVVRRVRRDDGRWRCGRCAWRRRRVQHASSQMAICTRTMASIVASWEPSPLPATASGYCRGHRGDCAPGAGHPSPIRHRVSSTAADGGGGNRTTQRPATIRRHSRPPRRLPPLHGAADSVGGQRCALRSGTGSARVPTSTVGWGGGEVECLQLHSEQATPGESGGATTP